MEYDDDELHEDYISQKEQFQGKYGPHLILIRGWRGRMIQIIYKDIDRNTNVHPYLHSVKSYQMLKDDHF